MSISKEEREQIREECRQWPENYLVAQFNATQMLRWLDALDAADERIAELQAENKELRQQLDPNYERRDVKPAPPGTPWRVYPESG